jgi:dihydrofolate reductase
MRPLELVVAMSRNRAIGKDGDLPWPRIPEDMKHFREITEGHAVIMGRKTYESMGKPLENRRNIIVSRTPDLVIEGCEVVASFSEAAQLARDTDGCPMVIGGAQIYEAALPRVTRIHLTEIDREVEGDTFFPPLVPGEWQESERRSGETPGITFVTLERAH